MIIYLAAPFNQKEAARKAREILVAAGHEVTSRWIDNHLSEYDDLSDEQLNSEAEDDLDDILDADALVLLNDFPCSAGRMFEWGFAYAQSKPIVVVGDATKSVFKHLRNTHVVGSAIEAAAKLHAVEAEMELYESNLN